MKPRPARSHAISRRLVGAVLALAILIAGGWYVAPLATELQPGSSPQMHTVYAADDVNLRTGPGTTFDVLTVVPAGVELSVGRDSVNGFSAVKVNGQQGWISTAYLVEPGVAYAAEHQAVAIDAEASTAGPSLGTVAPPPEPETISEAPPPIPESAPTSVAPTLPVLAQTTQVVVPPQPGEQWIEVNRSTRTVTLHNGEIVVASFTALIGKDLSADGYYSTAVGTHYVHVKEKALAETPFADGVYLTDFVGFDPERSNGFHSPTRDAAGNIVITGGTATLGCVRLAEADAQLLFDFATIGMRVDVHD